MAKHLWGVVLAQWLPSDTSQYPALNPNSHLKMSAPLVIVSKMAAAISSALIV